jgi:hypothetical protein
MSTDTLTVVALPQKFPALHAALMGAARDFDAVEAKRDRFTSNLGALNNNLIASGNEAARLGAGMKAALNGAGLGAASKEVEKLGGKLAGLKGLDDDEVGANLAKAIASGRLRSLHQYGVFLNDAEQKSIKAAAATGVQAKQQATLDAVMSATNRTIKELAAVTPEGAQRMAEFEIASGNALETIGQGAAEVRGKWMAAFTPMLEDLNDNHKGLLENAGALLQYGQAAGIVSQPILGVAGALMKARDSANLQRLAVDGLAKAQVVENALEKQKTGIALGEAGALKKAAGAAGEAAEETRGLARAKGLLGKNAFSVGGLTRTVGQVAGAAAVGAGVGLAVGDATGSPLAGGGAGLAVSALTIAAPSAILPIAAATVLGEAIKVGFEKLVLEKQDDEAEQGPRDAEGNVINTPEVGQGTKAEQAEKQWARARALQKRADEINPEWAFGGGLWRDEHGKKRDLNNEAESARLTARALGRQARRAGDATRPENREAEAASLRAAVDARAREMKIGAYTEQDAFTISNAPQQTVRGSETMMRNGDSYIKFEPIRQQERPSERAHKRREYKSRVAAPNFA